MIGRDASIGAVERSIGGLILSPSVFQSQNYVKSHDSGLIWEKKKKKKRPSAFFKQPLSPLPTLPI